MRKKDQTYFVWLPGDKLGDICKETDSSLMKGRFKHCQMFWDRIRYPWTVAVRVCSSNSKEQG